MTTLVILKKSLTPNISLFLLSSENLFMSFVINPVDATSIYSFIIFSYFLFVSMFAYLVILYCPLFLVFVSKQIVNSICTYSYV